MNASNYNKKDHFSFINYLDTSSITEGKIETIQKLIVGKDKIPSRAKRKVQKNDIIISTVRPNLKHYGIIKNPLENMIVSTGFVVLTPNDHIVNPEYLYWYLTQQHITDYLAGIAETSTTAYPSITADVIGNIEIELPSRDIQDKIANILTALDDKITINDKINKTLKEIAQTIFKHWFIDFEFPNENGEPYKSSGGKFVESELGMIPEGWKCEELNDIAYINPRETLKKGQESIYVEMANLPTNYARISSFTIKKYSGGTKFRNGDILFARITPCLENGKTAIVDFLEDGQVGFGSTEYIILRPKVLNTFYLYFLARDTEFRNHAIKNMNGSSGRQRVDASFIKAYKIICPPEKILEKFDQIVKPLFIKMKSNDMESKALAEIRDILLPKLMSGEIRIPEAEEAVESCLQKSN